MIKIWDKIEGNTNKYSAMLWLVLCLFHLVGLGINMLVQFFLNVVNVNDKIKFYAFWLTSIQGIYYIELREGGEDFFFSQKGMLFNVFLLLLNFFIAKFYDTILKKMIRKYE
ncbi:hypothetical protein FACS1894199_16350 [Bacteroidia bacterium]|nr:hypothetical protein FACS1894199_16350 [Bacteroidia bacterium]